MLLEKKQSTNWLGKPVLEGEDWGKPEGCPPHKHVTESRWAILSDTKGSRGHPEKTQAEGANADQHSVNTAL